MTMAPEGMRVSLHLNSYPTRASEIVSNLRDIAQRADQAGIAALALMDHFLHPGPQAASDPVLEGYTALGFLAAITEFTDLMLLVSGATHRHPVLLAKAATTLDVLSGGRARLGIGAGWYEAENVAYGLPFPPARERFAILEEQLAVIRQLWSDDTGPFTGERYQMQSTAFAPMPLRSPRPPIVVGGNGRLHTLRLAATYADGCNLLAGPAMGGIDEATSLISTLHDHCASIGRDPTEISLSMLYASPVNSHRDSAARFAEEMREYAALGISEVFVMPLEQRSIPSFIDELGSNVIPSVVEATAGCVR